MRRPATLGRAGALAVFGIAALEVVIMISPFAGFFYTGLQFGSLLGVLSMSPLTAWVDGFLLNHAAVTTSRLLEWHRKLGLGLFVVGVAGFLVSAAQVYGNKMTGRGVAKGLLYRFVRHPQYLSLCVAGWGLLTVWPRFLTLGATLARPEHRAMVVSTWPKPDAWMAKVFDAVVSDARVHQRLAEELGDGPMVATILPPRYGMKGMYYVMPVGHVSATGHRGPQMGVDPDSVDEPVEVVLSRAEEPYRTRMPLEEALDPGVRLIPLAIASVVPATGEVTDVRVPLPQNRWGPKVVMPVF